MKIHSDIVIVGAGPAGAITALLVAQRRPDLSIILLDAAAQPHAKPCGEFLSPGGLRVLALAGVEDAVMATGAYPLTGLSLMGPHGGVCADYHPLFGRRPFHRYGVGIRRERFDGVLQTAASRLLTLKRDTRLLGMERMSDGWSLRLRQHAQDLQLRCRILVGADGRLSFVRRSAGLDRPSTRKRFALVCRATGIPHGPHGEMHLGPVGQLGLAPLGEGQVNLNLLIAEASRGLLRHFTPGQLMRAALRATPSLRERTTGAMLGPVQATGSLPQGSHAIIADGLALVGDAAGFCDPFTGVGICFALQGAEALAETLATVSTTGPVLAAELRPYAQAYRRRCGWRRSLGERLQWLLLRRGLSEQLVAGLGRSPFLSRALVAMNGGYVSRI